MSWGKYWQVDGDVVRGALSIQAGIGSAILDGLDRGGLGTSVAGGVEEGSDELKTGGFGKGADDVGALGVGGDGDVAAGCPGGVVHLREKKIQLDLCGSA